MGREFSKPINTADMKRILILMALASCLTARGGDFGKGWTFWYEGHEKQTVDLPHDAMIHGERRPDVPGGGSIGYYDGALYIYEKEFDVPKEWLSSHVTFHFGGVYKEAKVYLNGNLAGGLPYGYSSFDVVADGFLSEGKNTIRVEADNEGQRSSRWYSGGGIYRNVTLTVQNAEYIEDVKISTQSISPAEILVNTTHKGGNVRIEILDNGKVVATAEGEECRIKIPDAKLWSAETPHLYSAKVSLKDANGNTLDEKTEKFGIRTLSWDENGFYVNGKKTLLKGGCLHADNGILGMAEYREATDRKISVMKSFGYNAIRSAHNPCSEEMLRTCDSLGMYIMDELWDMWFKAKNPNDYSKYFMDYYRKDLVEIVRKDFNHPSVIFYSIGNEISEPTAPGGLEITKDIVSVLHHLDGSRPVTGGMNTIILGSGSGNFGMNQQNFNSGSSESKTKTQKKKRGKKTIYQEPEMPEGGLVSFMDMMKGGLTSDQYNELVQQHILTDDYMIMGSRLDSIITPSLDELDIVGYNYATIRYPSEKERHPGRVVFGSETYAQDIWKNWKMVEEYPYVIGDFMWTAWDYLGETGIGSWSYGEKQRGYPNKLAEVGVLDLIGNPTGEVYLAAVTWEEKPGVPYIAVRPIHPETPRVSQWRGTNSIPSWTWDGHEGEDATVEVFSSARKVKLFLNGRLVGKAKPVDGIATFHVPYQSGKLTAKAYKLFGCCGETSLESATGNASISLVAENPNPKKGDVVFVKVDAIGENGQVKTQCSDIVSLDIEGATLLGFGSATPSTEYRFDKGIYPLHYGRGLCAIRIDEADVKIKAVGDNLPESVLEISAKL